MRVRTYVYISVSMYVCMNVCLSVCMYVCMYLRICVSIYLCIYVCIYVCVYVCIYVCMYVSIYLCMDGCILCMYKVYFKSFLLLDNCSKNSILNWVLKLNLVQQIFFNLNTLNIVSFYYLIKHLIFQFFKILWLFWNLWLCLGVLQCPLP